MKYQTPQVRLALARKAWTQADLARELCISYGYLIDILAGRRRSERFSREIAKLLGVRVKDVVRRDA